MFDGKFNLGNMANLMKNANKIKGAMENAQKEIENLEVSAETGAGLVKATVSGTHLVKQLYIDDALLKEEKEVIVELIIGAINSAQEKATKVSQEKMMGAKEFFSGSSDEDSE